VQSPMERGARLVASLGKTQGGLQSCMASCCTAANEQALPHPIRCRLPLSPASALCPAYRGMSKRLRLSASVRGVSVSSTSQQCSFGNL
jgi:hypothetical protein